MVGAFEELELAVVFVMVLPVRVVAVLTASSVPDTEHVTGEPTVRNSHGDEEGWDASTYVHSFDTGSKI